MGDNKSRDRKGRLGIIFDGWTQEGEDAHERIFGKRPLGVGHIMSDKDKRKFFSDQVEITNMESKGRELIHNKKLTGNDIKPEEANVF